MSGNIAKAIRLVEYLTRIASLRAKIARDVAEYSQILWIHEIPRKNGCFTQAWGPDEEYDQDIWIEVQTTHEPELPSVPELCRDWVDRNSIRKTDEIPELLDTITKQFQNPEWKEGADQPQFITEKVQLADHPEVQKTWDKYVEQKWLLWAEQHEKWQMVYRVYSALFAIHQEQLRLGEEYELVLAIGLLSWQTPSSQRVRRHLVVANASLEFEARLGRFTVRPNPDGANLRPELDMLDIEEQPARAEEAARKSLEGASDDPWDQDCVANVLRALVHSISPDGQYNERLETKRPLDSKKPTVEYAPALVLRKRSVKGLTETLKRIKKRIEDGETIPPEFADIAEIQKSDLEVSSVLETAPSVQTDVEIYFPKPSNEEQRQILEKTRIASGVLVQGPPGTGKSHTIANLICHLLATGKRTLITAKTPRALKVLERLIPEELRALCINLLGSGLEEKRSLEASVRAILQKNEQWQEGRAQIEIQKREDTLHVLRQERAEIENRLRTIRESETYPQTIADGAYRGTAAQIAQAVVRDKDTYGWFTDMVPLGSEFPLSEAELSGLLKGLRALTHDKRKELDFSWPDSLPSVELFGSLIGEEREAADQETNTSTNVNQNFRKGLSRLREETARSVRESLIKLRNEVLRLRSLPYSWIPDAIQDVSLGNDAVWQELHKASEQTITNIAGIVQIADETTVTLPDDHHPKAVLVDAEALQKHLANGGRLGWGPFRPKPVKPVMYIIKNVRVNDCLCDGLDRVALLVDVLRVQTELERGWGFWIGRTERVQGPHSMQFRTLESLTKSLHETLLIKDKISQCKEALAQVGNFPIPTWHDESRLQTLVQTCTHLLARIRKSKVENDIKEIESPIAALAARANAHPVTNEFLDAIRSRNADAFARSHAKIEKLCKEKKAAFWVNKTLKRLKEAVPGLADDLGANPADDCWNGRIKQMSAAWRWAQARTWIEDYIRKEDAHSLEKRVLQIEDEIGKIIAHIASLHAWSFCFRRMEEDHGRHMEAWQQSMRRLGKGTGRHAPRHRREAQKHLNKCREAVPAWVMPLHRIWDTVDPAPGIFDMIVVDEASQCGFEALPLFYLGKKVLIVGDDKQISPDAVGVPRDAVHRLMEEYLYDFEFRSSFDVENSLFDHGKLRYGTRRITLREHFRCMPEIIRFSNDLCYSDTPLIPLRQYGSNRLLPIRRVHVPNGYREGSHSRVINRPEAECIADKIVELCHDEQYANKTMGVVVLQGDAQARLIEEQLLVRLGAEELEKRRLVCGNPYSFQGDERDIMFLSMVAATNERIGPLAMSADERRFNVAASRARDQIWLFHSVTRDDLSTSCLRRRLLEFFQGTIMQPIPGINLEELEKSANEANRSIVAPPDPFHSWFEVDVALQIARKGYHVIPQFEVARKFIDFVVEGGRARLAVECDGDEFHGVEQYEKDMQRQRLLERCGWAFFRIRASGFYANKDDSLNGLWLMLEERGIQPQREESTIPDEQHLDSNEQESGSRRPESYSGEEPGKSGEESSINIDRVEVGDTVVYISDASPDSERQVMITGSQSNPDWGTVNFKTPIAQSLLGASIGDEVQAQLPMGSTRLRIKEIKKGSQ